MKQLIVGLAGDIRSDARASFFYYNDSEPTRTLDWEEGLWRYGTGRRQTPRPKFEDGDRGPGDELFRLVDSDEICKPCFVPDVDKLAPHLRKDDREYQTFIAVPVTTPTKKFGFLGVDALNAGDLTEEDVKTIRILAMALAVGLSIADQGSPSGPVPSSA